MFCLPWSQFNRFFRFSLLSLTISWKPCFFPSLYTFKLSSKEILSLVRLAPWKSLLTAMCWFWAWFYFISFIKNVSYFQVWRQISSKILLTLLIPNFSESSENHHPNSICHWWRHQTCLAVKFFFWNNFLFQLRNKCWDCDMQCLLKNYQKSKKIPKKMIFYK